MSIWARARTSLGQELDQPVSPTIGWRHAIGALTVFFFVVEILTGILLMVYYQPTAGDAYDSVQYIMSTANLGWLVRGLHVWAGTLLVLFALLHLVRVWGQGAYRGGRGFNWGLGVLLLLMLLAFGFTGMLLPWDQAAFWTIDEAREAISHVPFLGPLLLGVLWGGIEELGEGALLRFYVFHVGLLPWITVALLGLHLYLVGRQGLHHPGDDEREAGDEK